MADTIKIGSLNIDKIYLGINGDVEVYLGTVKVWPEDVPPTPFNGKYKFTLTDDSVVSGECDSSSELARSVTSVYTATMKEAVVGDCVTSIGGGAFSGCTSLTSIDIPNSVTSINSNAFSGCTSLTSIDIPNSVTSISGSAFQGCSGLTSVTIGSGVTSIGASAFKSCSGLTSVNIPSGVNKIRDYTFENCTSLTSVTIPSGVTEIGQDAFHNCSSLTSVEIPSSVYLIGSFAFLNCSSLTSVTVRRTTPSSLSTSVFLNTNDCPIYVPSESVNAYKTAINWKDYASRIFAIP